ncbi:hypothetical protein BV20DRAFT_1057013 [Pilatotrama ljubarskyi]|nr:hypothetical protein BV20DRAFT_1057013 [Pilatotrama ljubarskyi]
MTKKKTSSSTQKSSAATSANKTPTTEEGVRRSKRVRILTEKAKNLVLETDDAGAVLDEDDGAWMDVDDEDDGSQRCRLHQRDLDTFLKLCMAIRLFLSEVITEEQLTEADKLIREYCMDLVELYGSNVIRPNHHYATHTAECIRDYGPMRGYWTFIFERLNKILKSYWTNNHEGGEIEMTFFREFLRASRLHDMLSEGLRQPADSFHHQTCRLMQEATHDTRGTLQQLVEELEDASADENVLLSFSPRAARERLHDDVYFAFLTYMQGRYPLQGYHSDIALSPHPGSIMLPRIAITFDYVVIAGYRYYAARRSSDPSNSLCLFRVSEAGATWVGQIEDIVAFDVTESRRELFVYVRWLRPASICLEGTPWAACASTFMIQTWHIGGFLNSTVDVSPSPIVSLQDILSPVVQHVTHIRGEPCCVTMPIARKVSRLLYAIHDTIISDLQFHVAH